MSLNTKPLVACFDIRVIKRVVSKCTQVPLS